MSSAKKKKRVPLFLLDVVRESKFEILPYSAPYTIYDENVNASYAYSIVGPFFGLLLVIREMRVPIILYKK